MGIKHSGDRPKQKKRQRSAKMTSAAYEEQRRSYQRRKIQRKMASAERRGSKNRARALKRQLDAMG